jgi:uncharacterized protein involved in outer membrane biogenesis
MALSKKAKIWIIILLIPVVLVCGAAIAAKLYFTSERLKAMVIPRLEEATGRPVSMKDISLSVFPSLAVSIESLKISNMPGTHFDREEFISLENLRFNVKILELLARKLEISYVILDHPRIYLEKTKDGQKNYSGAKSHAGGEPPAGTPENKSGVGGELLLSNLEINDGVIESVDKKFDTHMLISGLEQTMSVAAGGQGQNVLRIEGTSKIPAFSYGSLGSWILSDQPVTAVERMSYDLAGDVLTLDDVKAQVKELPLIVGGTVSNLKEETIQLDLRVSSPGVQMAQLLSLIPPAMLKQAKGLTSSGDVKFTLTVKGPSSETMDPGIQGSFTIDGGTIQYASLPKSITNIALAGSFEKPSAPLSATGIGKFTVSKLNATIGANTIGGTLVMSDFSNPLLSATFNGSLNLAEVKDFYPLEQGTELAGIMKANVTLDGRVKTPQAIKANGSLEFQNVTIKTAGTARPIQNLNGSIVFNNQIVESKQLAMNIGQSDLNLSFTLRNYLAMVMDQEGRPSATLTLTSKELHTADLTGGEAPGTKGTEKTKGAPKKQGGLLPGIDADATVTIGKLVTDKFTFQDARGALSVSGGVVNLKNFSVNAFQGSIQTKGMLDLRDTSRRPFNLDLAINGVESNSLLPNFTSFGKYLFGKLTMTTKLKGDLNDTLGLNPQTLLGDGNVKISEGKLEGLPVTQKLADATNLSELRRVTFKDWSNAFSISNGRLTIKDLRINGGETNFLVSGSQGLDGSLDYVLTVKLPESASGRLQLPGVAGELLSFFKDKDGRISLNFQVSGMNTSPVLKLDTQAQQEMAKKALEDNLKKKAEEGLKKLFKKF